MSQNGVAHSRIGTRGSARILQSVAATSHRFKADVTTQPPISRFEDDARRGNVGDLLREKAHQATEVCKVSLLTQLVIEEAKP